MTPSMEKYAVKTAKVAFEKYNGNKDEAVKYIRDEFDTKYGWEIIQTIVHILNYALENIGVVQSQTQTHTLP